MPKKRYTLYLSRPLARKFDLVALQRQGAKSELVEEALRLTLEPQLQPGIEDGLARRLDELNRNVARIGNGPNQPGAIGRRRRSQKPRQIFLQRRDDFRRRREPSDFALRRTPRRSSSPSTRRPPWGWRGCLSGY